MIGFACHVPGSKPRQTFKLGGLVLRPMNEAWLASRHRLPAKDER
jgi:hypothetical protein